ncbi:Na+/H+ antiporter NhaA [Sphingomonas oleivorans]|uniref:Na(+)/H(+) antiporter NhaA n=1 Tax=Sphingomonas oleivorans TaxID=1735121 RepID=A0A2T5FZB1_9SPHN|nr:Na+/H+ antiporter NhaA [Sphingomonas oleivorans]PTQ12036.1 Na+/H+ antiporter NhaA [Sphingomonas oleivorans]
MSNNRGQLPRKQMDRFTRPFVRFLRIEATAGGLLLLATLLALLLSNSPWSIAYLSFWDMPAGFRLGGIAIAHSLKYWINDGLMTLFFFIVALELKREMVLGELRDPRIAALSAAGALGGMIVPPSLFFLLLGSGAGAQGWGTVMATDTAFLIGCLAIVGRRVPQSLRLFLLSLAIFDDVGAVLVVAIGYGGTLNWLALGLAGLGLAAVAGAGRLGIRSMLIYFALGGAVWLAFYASGIHPTLTGLLLGLMTPAHSWVSDSRLHAILDRVVAYPPGEHWSGNTVDRQDLRRARVAAREALSPLERLEIALHPWITFTVMPVFALANAGFPILPAEVDGRLAAAIFIGFVFGKPIGVVVFSYLAVQARLATRPADLPWGILAAGAVLTGIGFTMALFIAELAFDPTLLNSAKLGIFSASIVSATCGLSALAWLTSARRRRGGST